MNLQQDNTNIGLKVPARVGQLSKKLMMEKKQATGDGQGAIGKNQLWAVGRMRRYGKGKQNLRLKKS